jgi:hypothetical protein
MVYAAVAVGGVLLICFLIIRSVVRQHRQVKRRPEELRRAGAPLGLSLAERGEIEEEHERDRHLLEGSTLAGAVEDMDAGLGDALQGELDGFDVRLGEYSKAVAGGRLANKMHTVLLLSPKRSRFPRFYLQPEASATRPSAITGCAGAGRFVEAALPSFIEGVSLHVHDQDREWVEAALHRDGMLELLGPEPGRLTVEGLGDRLLVHQLEHVVPEHEVAGFVRSSARLARCLLQESPYRG